MAESKAYNIPAKQTLYKDTYYRSKLEAQWAVIFDNCNISTIYEPDRFGGIDGFDYLPDFYLPDGDFYAEVKATDDQLFESQQRISAVLSNPESPIAQSRGLLLLGPILYDELMKEDCAIFGSCLYFDKEKGLIVDDTFRWGSLKDLETGHYYASSFSLYRDVLKNIGEDQIDPKFTSIYPQIPTTASVEMFLDKGTSNDEPTALCGGLIAARRARFDFNDSIKQMLIEDRHIIGGTD